MKAIFQTKRLLVRQLQNSDSEAFYDMQGNLNVMRYIKNTMNLAESNQELARFIDYYTNLAIDFNIWAVVQTDTLQFIGICGVYKNDDAEFEIAYRLREKFWGNGYGKEIAKALIYHCFHKLHFKKLIAYAQVGNAGSISILEKEMEFEKEFYSEKGDCMERKYQLKR